MSNTSSVAEIPKSVVLLRWGDEARELDPPAGTTLADLLREGGAIPSECEVRINGRPIEEALLLRPGMVITVSRRDDLQSGAVPRWWGSIGMFQDDPAFDAMMDDVMAEKAAEKARG